MMLGCFLLFYWRDQMKSFCLFLALTIFATVAFAEITEHHNLSTVQSIDELELPPSYSESSEEALPFENSQQLLEVLRRGDFTILSEERVRDLFSTLERNPRARMRVAGGKCSYRRSYIQGHLRKLGISSGKLYIQCPSKKGHMRLIDQVTGRRYTFSNFHDTNIVAIHNGYNVMDVQFKDRPVSLSQYLAEVEASQKLKPLHNRATGDRGYCYWSIK